MDIKKMIEDQQELDEVIFEKGNITKYPFKEMSLAYKVEVGEALNEWAGFKFWKTNKKIDRDIYTIIIYPSLYFCNII